MCATEHAHLHMVDLARADPHHSCQQVIRREVGGHTGAIGTWGSMASQRVCVGVAGQRVCGGGGGGGYLELSRCRSGYDSVTASFACRGCPLSLH